MCVLRLLHVRVRVSVRLARIYLTWPSPAQTDVPKVVERVTIGASSTPERVTTHIVDTAADSPNLRATIESASVVCIVYDVTLPLDCVWRWLETVHSMRSTVPVVLVGTKIDLRVGSKANKALSRQIRPFMEQYKQVESCIESSAKNQLNVQEVFYFAQKAVLHPMAPLYDSDRSALSRECERALGRIFTLWDSDRDGVLSDDDLVSFQKHCFASALQPAEIARVRQTIAAGDPGGVQSNGFLLSGFLRLFLKFLQQGKTELLWTVLRKFGYSNSFALRLPESNLAKDKGSTVQLSAAGEAFARNLFALYDKDRDGHLSATETAELFAFTPETARPWADYRGVETSHIGAPTLGGFLARWQLALAQQPDATLDALVWLGADVDAIHELVEVVPRDAWASRKLLPIAVAGADGVGKSAVLHALIGKHRDAAALLANGGDSNSIVCAFPAGSAAKGRYALVCELAHGGPANADWSPYYAVLACFDPANAASYDVAIGLFEALDRERKPVLFVATKTDAAVLEPAHRVHRRLAEAGLMPVVTTFNLASAPQAPNHAREQAETTATLHGALAALVADPALGLARGSARASSTWRTLVRGGLVVTALAATIGASLVVLKRVRK